MFVAARGPFVGCCLACLGMVWLLDSGRAAEEAPEVRVTDAFETDTLKDYEVKGAIRWQKGQVQLPAAARLTRTVGLGFRSEVLATLRLPAGKDESALHIRVQGDGASVEVAIEAKENLSFLHNLTGTSERVALVAGPGRDAAEASWNLRVEQNQGVVRARAWRSGTEEPAGWQTTRYCDRAGWEPHSVIFSAGKTGGGTITSLERVAAQQIKDYGRWQRRAEASLADVAEALPEGAVLVELVKCRDMELRAQTQLVGWRTPHHVALVLEKAATPKGAPSVRFLVLGPAEPIDKAIHAWRKRVQEGSIGTEEEERLRDLVWEPLARVLPLKARRLILAPDGELALLPFEALRLKDGRYLVEEYAVSYVNSGLDLLPPLKAPQPAGPALVLADPDYDFVPDASPGKKERTLPVAEELRAKGLRFRRLPGFAREARAVEKYLQAAGWKETQVLQGRDASEEALARIGRPRLLYLITHGYFLQDVQPSPSGIADRSLGLVSDARLEMPDVRFDARLRSGLALAGANQWKTRSERGLSDGLLTALEVQDLDLSGTELVVLSACETGLGELAVGEGVLGLRRAFQQAGAQTVLASLWKVPDTETERLIARFLELWLAGKPKAAALRQAQREFIEALRKEADAQRRLAPPLLWAGFICHGQP